MEKYFLVGLLTSLFSFNSYSLPQTENTPYYEPYQGHQSYVAVIEEVIDITYHEFRSIKYRVAWNGQQIIVRASNLEVKKEKGDKLKFLVMWNTIESDDGPIKNLAFSALPD